MLPKDPMILLSYLNTQLRDRYPSLEALCEDLQMDRQDIVEKMASIDYIYEKDQNQFV